MAGESEEDVVEGRAANPGVVQLDASLAQLGKDSGQGAGAELNRNLKRASGVVHGDRAGAVASEDLAGSAGVSGVDQCKRDAVAADLRFELIRRAFGDHATLIHDVDAVGEVIGLFELLRGEEHGGAAGDEALDDPPQGDPTARIEAGRRLIEE